MLTASELAESPKYPTDSQRKPIYVAMVGTAIAIASFSHMGWLGEQLRTAQQLSQNAFALNQATAHMAMWGSLVGMTCAVFSSLHYGGNYRKHIAAVRKHNSTLAQRPELQLVTDRENAPHFAIPPIPFATEMMPNLLVKLITSSDFVSQGLVRMAGGRDVQITREETEANWGTIEV